MLLVYVMRLVCHAIVLSCDSSFVFPNIPVEGDAATTLTHMRSSDEYLATGVADNLHDYMTHPSAQNSYARKLPCEMLQTKQTSHARKLPCEVLQCESSALRVVCHVCFLLCGFLCAFLNMFIKHFVCGDDDVTS